MNKLNFKIILSFLKYLKPYWKKEAVVWLLSFGIAGLSLAYPYIAKLVVDKAYQERNWTLFIELLVTGGLVFIISSLFQVVSNFLREYIDLKVRFDLQKIIFQKIENLPYSFFQLRPTGEYIYKSLIESSQVSDFITSVAPELFYIIPKFLLIFTILFFINWKMAVFIFVVAPVLNIPTFFIARKVRKQSEKSLNSSQDILETARESFSNMQLVKVFGKEKKENRRFVKQMIKNIRLSIISFRLNAFSSFLESWANKLLLGLITLYGGYNIIKGQISLGSFTAIMLYINQLLDLENLFVGFFVHRLNTGLVSVRRLSEIMNSWPQELEDKNTRAILLSSGEIEFRDVSFGYYPKTPILEHISLHIKSGSSIGLVGNSGRGKTTLVSLIVKLYQISEGEILVDGQDINLIKNSSLRQQIGVALQKPILWNDTIRNNITYSILSATDEEVLQAAMISCAYDFIKELPQGYNTIMGEGAVRLSEGQKQRISLARAIIKKPKILIIDEGMSSLDSQTEDSIIDNIKKELKNTTMIVISHRLSTIKKVDRVYFLEKKDKMSFGHHEELLHQNPQYKELFASQIEEEHIKIKS